MNKAGFKWRGQDFFWHYNGFKRKSNQLSVSQVRKAVYKRFLQYSKYRWLRKDIPEMVKPREKSMFKKIKEWIRKVLRIKKT